MLEEIAEITKNYPRFSDGRIDYTSARVCPIINCTIVYQNEILLMHRSKQVIAYPETWNGISGFIDTIKPLEELARQELKEEANIVPEDIKAITVRPMLRQTDDTVNREWLVFPLLVELKRRPNLQTNWESNTASWVPREQVLALKLMPFYAETFQKALYGEGSDNDATKL